MERKNTWKPVDTMAVPFALRHNYLCTEIRVEVRLRQNADSNQLSSALKDTLDRFPAFAVHAVTDGTGLYYEKTEGEPVVVPASQDPLCLCSEQTGNYPVYISYEERSIYLHFTHMVCDGRGTYPFMQYFLASYFKQCGENVEAAAFVTGADIGRYSEDRRAVHEKEEADLFALYGDESAPLYSCNTPENVFEIPAKNAITERFTSRRYRISLPMEGILSAGHGADATPLPVLYAVMGHAIRKAYDVPDDADVSSLVPADTRRYFDTYTLRNAVLVHNIPYSARLDKMDFGMRATAIRAMVDLLSQRESVVHNLGIFRTAMAGLANAPIPIQQKAQMVASSGSDAMKATITLSYLGAYRLGKGVGENVESIHLYVPAYTAMTMEANEYNGILSIDITRGAVDPEPVEVLCNEMRKLFGEANFEDLGNMHFCDLRIEGMD